MMSGKYVVENAVMFGPKIIRLTVTRDQQTQSFALPIADALTMDVSALATWLDGQWVTPVTLPTWLQDIVGTTVS